MSLPRSEERSLEDVLAAADAFLGEDRWRSASMNDLAQASRVSRGYLYKHFTNRDGLLLAVLERRAHSYNLRARRTLGTLGGPELVVQGILLGLEATRRSPHGGPLLGANALGGGPLRSAALEGAVRQARELWLPMLTEARERGEVDDLVDLDDLVEWIVMLQLVLCSHHGLLGDGTGVIERWLRTLLVTALSDSPAADPAPAADTFTVITS